MRRLVTALLVGLVGTSALAEGSLDFKDIKQLLSQQPEVTKLLAQQLEIRETGIGNRIGSHFTYLGGGRIGPYVFQAKSRGQAGPYTLELTICTKVTFLGPDGRETESQTEARKTRENLRFVIIRDESPKNQSGECPE